MSKRIRRVAFTLVEMLVVLAVILILVLLLMPALSRAKESGRTARCASNLRQLQLAVMNYAGDGSLPWAVSTWVGDNVIGWTHQRGWVDWYTWPNYPTNGPIFNNRPNDGSYDWQNANGIACLTNGTLWIYANTKDLYLCPTFALKTVCGSKFPVRSYSMNASLSGRNVLLGGASVNILFGDDRAVATGPFDPAFTPATEIGQWHSSTGRVGTGQVIYQDGHVEKR